MEAPIQNFRDIIAACLEQAIKDVYNFEMKYKLKPKSHISDKARYYSTAVTYFESDRSTSHLKFLGIDLTGKDILAGIRAGKIKPVKPGELAVKK